MTPATAVPPGRFLAEFARRSQRTDAETLAPPPGATIDAAGRWIVGDILLIDRESLASALGLRGVRDDATLALAAIERWGDHAAAHLRGEFAFAAWDAPRRSVLAARDGMGLRLLYFTNTEDVLRFSDDPARLARFADVDATLDPGALAAFLVDGVDEDLTRTVYRGVRTVPAGHALSQEGGARLECRRHWHFPSVRVATRREARELPAMFTSALDAAVRDRLRGATASLLLSGGIDSASIAASVGRVRPDVALRAFTSSFASLLPEVELPWARRVATHLGIPLVPLQAGLAPALTPTGGVRTPLPLDEPTWIEWRASIHSLAGWSETTLYGEDGDALLLPATLAEMVRAERWPGVAASILSYLVRNRRVPYLGTGARRIYGAKAVDAPSPMHSWLRASARAAAAPAPIVRYEPHPPLPYRDWTRRRLMSPLWQAFGQSVSPAWTGADTTFRLPLVDDRVLTVAMAAPSVPWLQRKRLIRAAAAQARALPGEVIWRPKTPVYGYYEAFIALWRARWDGRALVASTLAEWVDAAALQRALREGTVFEVCDAWRVLELSSWIDSGNRDLA